MLRFCQHGCHPYQQSQKPSVPIQFYRPKEEVVLIKESTCHLKYDTDVMLLVAVSSLYGTSVLYPIISLFFLFIVSYILYFSDPQLDSKFTTALSSLPGTLYMSLNKSLSHPSKLISIMESLLSIPLWNSL